MSKVMTKKSKESTFCYGSITKKVDVFVKIFSKASLEQNISNLEHFKAKKERTGLDTYNHQIKALKIVIASQKVA